MEAKKFELFMGCLGNGITVCNKAVMEHGDYKHVAHISPEGKITWYVSQDYVPEKEREKIENAAAQNKADYDKWFNSLSEEKRYQITLDKMSPSELIAHIQKKQEERRSKPT